MDTQPGIPPSNPTPVMPPAGMGSAEKKSVGPAVGIIIIVIVLVVGGLYFWGRALEQGSSDETSLDQVEADLNQSDVDGLDQDLQELDQEVGSM